MGRLFISTLKEVAFDWFRSLPSGSINSWIDLETQFLSRFYEGDTDVTTPLNGPERRRIYARIHKEVPNLSLMCPAGMPLPMLL